jgi:pilus assembly protein TadC
MIAALALAWAALAATAVAALARLGDAARRARRLRPRPSRGEAAGVLIRQFAGRRGRRRETAAFERELPVCVDLLSVALGAGLTPYLAVRVAAEWAPARPADLLAGAIQRIDEGATFATALAATVPRRPSFEPVVDALLASERLGAPVGPALARVGASCRADARRRAQEHARSIPIRLLFPLVLLILPAFGLLALVPNLLAGFRP